MHKEWKISENIKFYFSIQYSDISLYHIMAWNIKNTHKAVDNFHVNYK